MEAKISKKSYYLPKILMDYFKIWCKPGRDYSPKIAGAILHFMALDAATREYYEKAAYSDLETIKSIIATASGNRKEHPQPFGNLPQLIPPPQEVAQDIQSAKKHTKHRRTS